jgi:hypothetical protein
MPTSSFEGNPPYLSYGANSAPSSKASITLVFKDEDGFKVHDKTVLLRTFTTLLDKGAPAGLGYEFDEFLSVDTYARFDHVELMWNLLTEAPKLDLVDPDTAKPDVVADHCAPNT